MAASFTVPDKIEALLNRPIPDRLWHYTTYGGLFGILDEAAIHATDVRFLNDAEEFLHARKLFCSMAEEKAQKLAQQEKRAGLGEVMAETLRRNISRLFDEGPLSPRYLQLFVACFCEHKDQLSQWRGYGAASSGLSLGLDLRDFRKFRKSEVFVLAPCIYEETDKRRYLDLVLQDIVDSVQAAQRHAYDAAGSHEITRDSFERWYTTDPAIEELNKQMRSASIKAAYCLLQIAALMKHPAFREEAEWRIVIPTLMGFNDQHHPISFAAHANTLTPKVRYPLPGGTAVVQEVVTGPSSHPSASFSVEQLLRQTGANPVVTSSDAPYRII